MLRTTRGSHPFEPWAILILTLLAGLTLGSGRALAQDDLQQLDRRAALGPFLQMPRHAVPAGDPDVIPIGLPHSNRRPPKVPERYLSRASRLEARTAAEHGQALWSEGWMARLAAVFAARRD